MCLLTKDKRCTTTQGIGYKAFVVTGGKLLPLYIRDNAKPFPRRRWMTDENEEPIGVDWKRRGKTYEPGYHLCLTLHEAQEYGIIAAGRNSRVHEVKFKEVTATGTGHRGYKVVVAKQILVGKMISDGREET